MNKTQKSIALALGGAFALSMATTTVNAAENPFALKTLSSGYQVADHHDEKMKDGKCGTGKCGAEKKAGEAKCSAEKAKEGACSADKAKEGSCSAEKMKEGACSAEKK
jgi:uncharacterized low-complexity protein